MGDRKRFKKIDLQNSPLEQLNSYQRVYSPTQSHKLLQNKTKMYAESVVTEIVID